MHGLMMNIPLLVSNLIRHADRQHGGTEIVSRSVEGPIVRSTWREVHQRSRQLANALEHLDVRAGDRVATLAWNTQRHLELYYAVSGSGAIIHTVNPRLFDEQIAYILNHAESELLFFDLTFLPLVERLIPQLPKVRHFVLMSDRAHAPADYPVELLYYEDLIHRHSGQFTWPQFDEQTASALCYTSGTTGNPKGALYSHRSAVLHAYACALPDSFDLSARDVVMPVVPMYHVNAWGLPYIAPLVGAKLVLPGPRMDGAALHELIRDEGVTFSNGVPTVWQGLLHYVDANPAETAGRSPDKPFGNLDRLVIGGSACPPSLMENFAARGVKVLQAWGMTELSPIGTVNSPDHDPTPADPATRASRALKQGRALPGVEFEILDQDNNALPHDGQSFGELVVRALWAIRGYYKQIDNDHFNDGWFRTGDVATLDPAGYMQITDRAKDVIKSGGEWISSIALENILMSHPAVVEAAAVAIPDPKWDERPLMAVVLKPGTTLGVAEMRAFFQGKVATWWIPDALEIVDEIPHTATGKLNKLKLRDVLQKHRA